MKNKHVKFLSIAITFSMMAGMVQPVAALASETSVEVQEIQEEELPEENVEEIPSSIADEQTEDDAAVANTMQDEAPTSEDVTTGISGKDHEEMKDNTFISETVINEKQDVTAVKTADNWNTFVMALKDLEQYATEYAAENGGSALSLMSRYIRTGSEQYNTNEWSKYAGEEDTAFVSYVQEKDTQNNTAAQAVRGVEILTAPNGQGVDIARVFAAIDVANAEQLNNESIDLGTWVVDLCDLLSYVDDRVTEGDVDQMASQILNNYLGYEDTEETNFSTEDIRADLDAYYILNKVREDDSVYALVNSYFNADLADEDRASYFVAHRFASVTSQEELRFEVAKAYEKNGKTSAIEAARDLSVSEQLRTASSYAFADYLFNQSKAVLGLTPMEEEVVESEEFTTEDVAVNAGEVEAAKDWQTFMEDLDKLQEYANEYAAEHDENANELVINYIRTGVVRYTTADWVTLAGAEKADFAKYVKEQDALNGTAAGGTRGVFEITAPDGNEVELGHMFGALNVAYTNNGNQPNVDLGSWAGDISDLIGYTKDKVVDSNIEEMTTIVREKYLGYDDPEVSSFGILDLRGDLDSFYLATKLQTTTRDLNVIMKNYFTKDLSDRDRAVFFLKNRFANKTTQEDIRAAILSDYKSNNGCALLESKKGTTDRTDLRTACSYAFADYLFELANGYLPAVNTLYDVFSSTSSTIAPGVTQKINYATTADNKQIVYYLATADISRSDVSVYANYNNNDGSEWAMSRVTDQMAAAAANHSDPDSDRYIANYTPVVGVNADFFNMSTGAPSGALVMEGVEYHGVGDMNFFAIMKDGSAFVGNGTSDWKKYRSQIQEAVGAAGTLVKDGKIVVRMSANYTSNRASRTAVGVTDDGQVVLMVLDGRQEPFSAGGSSEEVAQIMLEAGCVDAVMLDGGGSTTFAAREEGEDSVRVVNSPSDGYERSVSSSIMVVSTAETSTEFDHARLTAEHDYMTIGSSIQIEASGVSKAATAAEIPANAQWRVSDDAIASVDENGLATGIATGDVEVQLVVDGSVVGSKKLHVVKTPDALVFTKSTMNLIYGVGTELPLQATYNGNIVVINSNDVSFSLNPERAGSIEEFTFIGNEASGVRNVTVTATLSRNIMVDASMTLALFSNGEAIFDFDDATSGDRQFAWKRNVSNSTTEDEKYYHVADPSKGMDISYIFALDMESMPIPEKLSPLLGLVAGGDVSGVSPWKLLLQLAERVNAMSNVKVTMDIDPNLDLDVSKIKLVNDYFRITDSVFDAENHKLTITLNFIKQSEPIDGATANPICIVSGINAVPKKNAAWDENNCLTLTNKGNLIYDIYLRASALYAFASIESNQENYGLYPFVDTEINPTYGAPDRGGHFAQSYVDFTDTFTLDRSSFEGWKEIGGQLYYFENNTAVTGIQKVPGYEDRENQYFYRFDENGVCTGKVSGLFSVDGNLYMAKNGAQQFGWQTNTREDNVINYYYFDKKTGVAVDGKQKIDGYNYIFTDRILTRGEIVTDSKGSRYMWAGEWVTRDWVKIDENYYYAEMNGYFHVGIYAQFSKWWEGAKPCMFDENGVWQKDVTGFFDYKGKTYYIEEGILKKGPNLIYVDGYYYYINYGEDNFYNHNIVKNTSIWVDATNGYVNPGRYTFDREGRMINPPALPKVNVHFDANSGSGELGDQAVTKSVNSALAANTFVREGYTFAGWNTEADGSGTAYGDQAEVKFGVDTTLYAQWKAKTYTVEWIDGDGKILQRDEEVEYGSAAPAYNGNTPTKAEDDGHTYTFSGWDPAITAETKITADTTFTAVFNAVVKQYTVIFANEDGTLLDTQTVNYGVVPIYGGATPTKDADEEQTYEFDGWNPALSEVTGDVTYTATFKGMKVTGWKTDTNGTTYLVKGEKTYFDTWKEIDGQKYYFDANGYVVKGVSTVSKQSGSGEGLYVFDAATGKFLENQSGLYSEGEDTYWTKDGEVVEYAGLVRAVKEDGEVNYYYFAEDHKAVKNVPQSGSNYWVEKTNDLLPQWGYYFDANGVILHDDTSKNGVLEENGAKYYYIDGIRVHFGMFKMNGDLYYAKSNGQLVTGKTYYCERNNGLKPEGPYTFDEEGKLVEKVKKNGVISENDSLFYYVDGELSYAGLIKINDDYYYVRSNGELVHGRKYWTTKTNGLLPEASYEFADDGKLILPAPAKNGIVEENGSLYYYLDGKITYAGLIEMDGDYYYVKTSGEVIHGRSYWISRTNGLVKEGSYEFDDSGKMINPPAKADASKNGIVSENGSFYYYVNGVLNYAGLIDIDGDYYYVKTSGEVIHGRSYWISKTNGLVKEGSYTFGEEGKMVK